ncbi:ATP-dependent DNA helicase PIF1-like protein [Tanacetum coccineum]
MPVLLNDVVDSINEHLLEKLLGEEMVYLSCDSVDKTERNAAIDQSIFSPEFINGLKIVRKQFPISLSFAMTINKSQGQSLSKVGLYLPRPVFTHGQLYVVVSRMKSKKGLKVVVFDPDGSISKATMNVVYKEVIQGVRGMDIGGKGKRIRELTSIDTEATSSSSRSVTPRDLESQKDENTTPINAAKTIATTCADKDPTKKRVAEDDIGSESSNAKKKAVAVKIEKDT